MFVFSAEIHAHFSCVWKNKTKNMNPSAFLKDS